MFNSDGVCYFYFSTKNLALECLFIAGKGWVFLSVNELAHPWMDDHILLNIGKIAKTSNGDKKVNNEF